MSTTTKTASPTSHDGSALRLPKDAQWDIICSKLDTLSLSTAAAPRWLDLVEKPVLLTVIAKLRSELELLHLETDSQELQCPNSAAKSCTQPFSTANTLPSPGPSLPLPITRPRLLSRRARNRNNDDHSPELCSLQTVAPLRREQSDGDQFSRSPAFSPLSPTFGPRRGLLLSGTLDRRCSIPRYSTTMDGQHPNKHGHRGTQPYSAPLINATHATHSVLGSRHFGLEEKRIMWEAAWAEIERNIDSYTEKFEDLRYPHTKTRKDDVWTELIALLGEKRALCHEHS